VASFVGLAIWSTGLAPASARRITRNLRETVALVEKQTSPRVARALLKLFQIQGYKGAPLHKGFVDGAIGRDSVNFIDRQLKLLDRLEPKHACVRSARRCLSEAQAQLRQHGAINGTGVEGSARAALAGYRFNPRSYQRNVRILAGEVPVRVKDPQSGRRKTVVLDDRHITNPDNKLTETASFLQEFYKKLGVPVELQRFKWRGKELVNVVATIPGRTKETIVLGAHYDTAVDRRARTPKPNGSQKVAPGADDNGSGVAALMEAGRAFKGRRFEKTIKLVHFAAEERPGRLAGSHSYLRAAAKAGEQIDAMVNFDCVGHDSQHGRVLLTTTRNERALFMASEISRSSDQLKLGVKMLGRIPSDRAPSSVNDSDSYSFAVKGIPTVFVIEDGDWRIGLHDRFDVSSRVDPRYAGKIIKSTLAAVSQLASPGKGQRDFLRR